MLKTRRNRDWKLTLIPKAEHASDDWEEDIIDNPMLKEITKSIFRELELI